MDFENSQLLDEDEEGYTVRIPKRAPAYAVPPTEPVAEQAPMPQTPMDPETYQRYQAQLAAPPVQEEQIPMQRPAELPAELQIDLPTIGIEGEFKKSRTFSAAPKVQTRELPPVMNPTQLAQQQAAGIGQASADYQEAVAGEGIAGAEAQEAQAVALEQKTAQLEEREKKDEQMFDDVNARLLALTEAPKTEVAGTKKEKSNLGNRILMGVAAFFAGFGSGPNQVLRMIDNELDRKQKRDLAALKTSSTAGGSRIKAYMQSLGNTADALKLARITDLKSIESEAAAKIQKTKSPEVANKANVLIKKLQLEREKLMNEISSNQFKRMKDLETEAVQRGAPSTLGGKPVANSSIKTKDDRMRAVPIPGTKTSYLSSVEKGGEKIKEMLVSAKPLYAMIMTIDKFRAKYKSSVDRLALAGKSIPFSRLMQKDVGRIKAVARQIILKAKELENLGVLQEQDIVILSEAYPIDPMSLFDVEDGKLEAAKESIKLTIDGWLSTYDVPFDPRLFTLRSKKRK